MNELTNRPTHD